MNRSNNLVKPGWPPAVVGLTLEFAGLASQAVNYNPDTTMIVYVHGFDADGWNSTWLAGDDTTNNVCGLWNDVNTLAAVMGRPTWLQNPPAPHVICGATYYGSTLPAWYSPQDVAEDNALNGTQVPQYALRMAKYIRYCLNRARQATSAHIISASFGTEITRYLLEHNLLNLCSDGKISRWSPVVGVLRGNWMASSGNLTTLARILGIEGSDNPDLTKMSYNWVNANISANTTMNSPHFGRLLINQFTATADGDGQLTAINNNANDTINMLTDQFFAGYTTTAALHPATDGTLLMPGLAWYRNTHTGIRNNTGFWASLAAAAQGNRRVTIRLSRFKALVTGDSWPYGKGEWVYSATVVSPRSAVLYGNTHPVSDFAWEDGVSPKHSLAANETIYPNTILFDMIIPPGETQLHLTFKVAELDNMYKFYGVVEHLGPNGDMGTFTVTISTTQDGTITVSNSNLEADLTTTIKSLYCDPPTMICPPNLTITNAPGQCGAVVNLGTPQVSNGNCTILTVTNNGPAIVPVGTNQVTWMAVDTSGNLATCMQTVMVLDSEAPTLVCPPDIVATNIVVALGVPGATNDNCGILTVTNNAPAVFPTGTNWVTWTAVDTSGNLATCVQTVTIVPPSLGNLEITYHGGTVTLSWSHGVLQQADEPLGPYGDVVGAVSPYPIEASAAQKYYRLRWAAP